MTRYLIDTNLFVCAFRDPATSTELRYHRRLVDFEFLPPWPA